MTPCASSLPLPASSRRFAPRFLFRLQTSEVQTLPRRSASPASSELDLCLSRSSPRRQPTRHRLSARPMAPGTALQERESVVVVEVAAAIVVAAAIGADVAVAAVIQLWARGHCVRYQRRVAPPVARFPARQADHRRRRFGCPHAGVASDASVMAGDAHNERHERHLPADSARSRVART